MTRLTTNSSNFNCAPSHTASIARRILPYAVFTNSTSRTVIAFCEQKTSSLALPTSTISSSAPTRKKYCYIGKGISSVYCAAAPVHWASGLATVLPYPSPSRPRTEYHPYHDPGEEHAVKVLGLHWDPNTDQFAYHTSIQQISSTKRQVLSVIARVFDPIGALGLILLWAKCFFTITMVLKTRLGRSDVRRAAIYVAAVLHRVTASIWFKFTTLHRRRLSSGHPASRLRGRISKRIRGCYLPSHRRYRRQHLSEIYHLQNKGCPSEELCRWWIAINTPFGAVRSPVIGPHVSSRAFHVVQRNSRISSASVVELIGRFIMVNVRPKTF